MYNSNNGKKKVIVTPNNIECYLNINNPYLKRSLPPFGSLITFDNIHMPDTIFLKAESIENLTCSIKIICFCDIFMSIYYFDVNLLLGIILFIVSFNGYLSTINYKKSYLACYLWYQYIQLLTKFIYVLYVLTYYLYNEGDYYLQNNTSNQTDNTTISRFTEVRIFAFDNPVFNCLFITSMFIVQIFVTYYIHIFFRLMPKEEDYQAILNS